MTKQIIRAEAWITQAHTGDRLDQVAAQLFPDYSRSCLQNWIKKGQIRINGQIAKPNRKVVSGEKIAIEAELDEQHGWQAENIPLDIVFEDEQLLVVNKVAGLVVHPAAGNWQGTLVNALLFHCSALTHLPRAGIVHRLDKDTSGLMVIAKTLEAHKRLVEQLQARSVKRRYRAFAFGSLQNGGVVHTQMGRHPWNRTKMAVLEKGGKEAITHYQVVNHNERFSDLKLQLETGRTHQIRVHMKHLGHPLVGDPVYQYASVLRNEKQRAAKGDPAALAALDFTRQALHAEQLSLLHPATGEEINWHADIPEDMQRLRAAILD